jgi:hypothetical protein
MGVVIPDKEDLANSDLGYREIPVRDMAVGYLNQAYELAKMYADLVQNNPEYQFGISRDEFNETVTIRWKLRT